VWQSLWLPPRIGTAWAVILGVLVMLGLVWKVPSDPDLFWHIRAGNDILAQGIPHVDWYSFTMPNFPWVDHEWLIQLPMALLHRLGGLRLVSVAYALLLLATLTWGLRWSLMRKVAWPWVVLTGTLFAAASWSFLGSRPQMLTYALLLGLLGVLARIRERTRYVWLLPAILLLWANLHGSFVMGLAVLWTWTGGEVLLRIVPGLRVSPEVHAAPLPYSVLWKLIAVGVLAVAATFANPYLHGVWVEALRTVGDRELHKNIIEWFSPDVRANPGTTFYLVSVVWVAAVAVRRARTNLPLLAVTLLTWVAGLLAVRNGPLFFLLAVPQVVLSVRELWPRLVRLVCLWPVLLVATALVVVWVVWQVPLKALWSVDRAAYVLETNRYPVAAAQYLAEHDELAEAHTFNSYGWGGYLLLEVPWFKTFIDGRMPSWEQDGVKIMDEYFKLDRLEPGWDGVLDTYDVSLVILSPDHKLATALLRKGNVAGVFRELFRDERAVILQRVGD